MKIIRESSEDEMILEFLKGELSSKRFSQNLLNILNELNIDKDIIIKGDINSKEQNIIRKQIIHKFRGYPNKELFNKFPKTESWKIVEFDTNDLDNIYYINYDYWNELSNNTSKPKAAAKNIMEGIEIYDVYRINFGYENIKLIDQEIRNNRLHITNKLFDENVTYNVVSPNNQDIEKIFAKFTSKVKVESVGQEALEKL